MLIGIDSGRPVIGFSSEVIRDVLVVFLQSVTYLFATHSISDQLQLHACEDHEKKGRGERDKEGPRRRYFIRRRSSRPPFFTLLAFPFYIDRMSRIPREADLRTVSRVLFSHDLMFASELERQLSNCCAYSTSWGGH